MSKIFETSMYIEDGESHKRIRFSVDLEEIVGAYPENNPVGEKMHCTSIVFKSGDSMLIITPYTEFLRVWKDYKENSSNDNIITYSKN